ncbi:hypothetical protein [Thalassospira alkalitolerans]|uniref:hypothetical protein n=1 Tax=Thalassospira alkalitolerans TaxID=1293890 RepID=UPI003AA90FE9
MAYRDDFVSVLELLSRAFDIVESKGFKRPVIVGGAAVELYTQGALVSGDIDIVTPWQVELEEALEMIGFVRSVGAGAFARGFQHLDLGFGVEIVGRTLMEGQADQDKILVIDLVDGGSVDFIAVEDLIADRMGQYNVPPAMRLDMLNQAAELLKLAETVDKAYLDRRISEETAGDFGLSFLEEHIDAQNDA